MRLGLGIGLSPGFFGSSFSPLSPTSATLVGWYDADVGLSSTWTDQSGAGNTLTVAGTPGAGASINGHASLHLNGTTQIAFNSTFALGTPGGGISLAIVCKPTAASGLTVINYDDGLFAGRTIGIDGTGKDLLGDNILTQAGSTTITNTWVKMIAVCGGVNSAGNEKLYLNGVLDATISPANGTLADGQFFGLSRTQGGNGNAQDVTLALVYRGQLSAGDIAALNTYMSTRYGI